MLGLRIYSCSLFEQFCPPKFPFLLWLKLLVCCTIESDMTQNQDPKCNPGPQICTETRTRTCRDDLHSAVGLLGDLIQLCNKPTTSTKEGRETWARKIAQTERACIHSQTKHSQDMFYLQKIHSQVSRMGKSTACLLLWGYAHASPQNCLF